MNNYCFKERLVELRGDKNQQEVADAVGIQRPTLSYYENGKRHPNAETLCRFAEYFNVSLDYLVGMSDVKERTSIYNAYEEGRNSAKDFLIRRLQEM